MCVYIHLYIGGRGSPERDMLLLDAEGEEEGSGQTRVRHASPPHAPFGNFGRPSRMGSRRIARSPPGRAFTQNFATILMEATILFFEETIS